MGGLYEKETIEHILVIYQMQEIQARMMMAHLRDYEKVEDTVKRVLENREKGQGRR